MAVIQRSFSPVKEWSWRSNSRQQVHPLTQIFLLLFRPSSTSELRQKGEPNATKTDTPHPQDRQDGIKRPRERRGQKTNDETYDRGCASHQHKDCFSIPAKDPVAEEAPPGLATAPAISSPVTMGNRAPILSPAQPMGSMLSV